MKRPFNRISALTLLGGSAVALVCMLLGITKVTADTGPAQPPPPETTPAENAPPSAGGQAQPAHHPSQPGAVKPGMQIVRQQLSPSGKLRIQYMRDRQRGIRQIAIQDAHNPANTTVLAQYKRNAWVVISPNDEWLVLNSRDGEAGAQLYQRTSAAPLKYEVPNELRAPGASLQDLVWQRYLSSSQPAASNERNEVTIDAIGWEPNSQQVSISVAPIPTSTDTALPEPWSCSYNVTTKQLEAPQEAAEASPNDQENAAPDAPAESEAANTADSNADQAQSEEGAADQNADLEGEKFPATRQEPITVADANELDLSDIRYAIFEMFARHGADITDPKMRKEFSQFSWYQPRPGAKFDDVEAEFSDVEKHNLDVLRRVRDSKVAAARRQQQPQHAVRGEQVEPDGARFIHGVLQGVSDALGGGDDQ